MLLNPVSPRKSFEFSFGGGGGGGEGFLGPQFFGKKKKDF